MLRSPSKSPVKRPTGSPIKRSTESPLKDSACQKSPSRRKSLRALGVKERRQTKSPTKQSPWPTSRAPELGSPAKGRRIGNSFPKLSEQLCLIDEGYRVLGLQPITTESLASDASRSPVSTRRRVRPLALGIKDHAVSKPGTHLVNSIDCSLEDSTLPLKVVISYDGQNDCQSLSPIARESTCYPSGPTVASVEYHSPNQETPRVVMAANAESGLDETGKDKDCPDQLISSQLVPMSPEQLSQNDDINPSLHDETIAIAPQDSTELALLSPERPSVSLLDTPDMALHDANLEASCNFAINKSTSSENVGEISQQVHTDDEDDLAISKSVTSDDKSYDDQNVGNEVLAMCEVEATSSEPPNKMQHFSMGSTSGTPDSRDAESQDDQLTVANDLSIDVNGQGANEVQTHLEEAHAVVEEPTGDVEEPHQDHQEVDGGVEDGNTDHGEAHAGFEVAHEDHEEPCQDDKAAMVTRTRSRTRISDDTLMLKDFLSRMQARKSAFAEPTSMPASPPESPSHKRSHRQALQSLDTNSPSPTKTSGPDDEPDSPLRAFGGDEYGKEDLGKPIPETASQRRSARTRLVTPAKSTPSLIPLRRAGGTDPIILKKSANQELSIATRANTRRNKGRARLPKVMLPELAEKMGHDATDQKEESMVRPQRSAFKIVHWDEEKLVQYQEATAALGEENEVKRIPKIRRLRGLGATNGTPAPNKVDRDRLAPTPSSKMRRPKAVTKV